MNFPKDGTFKVVESENALLIVSPNVNVTNGKPLIIADMPAMFAYLSRYLYARCEEQMVLKEAHEVAMKEAGITIVLPAASTETTQ